MKSLPITFDRVVTRRFDTLTGKELYPYIEVNLMQDRLDVRPGDWVRVTVTMLHKVRRNTRELPRTKGKR